jgi:hypothetical protein
VAAVTHLNSYITQEQQQLQRLKQQQQPQLLAQLNTLAGNLLSLWCTMAFTMTEPWLVQLLPTVAPAAELALQLLTGSQGSGLACAPGHWLDSWGLQQAALTFVCVGGFVDFWRVAVRLESRKADLLVGSTTTREADLLVGSTLRAPTAAEAAVVSDVVQKALILHFCILLQAWQKTPQQQQQQQQQQQLGTFTDGQPAAAAGVSPRCRAAICRGCVQIAHWGRIAARLVRCPHTAAHIHCTGLLATQLRHSL